MEAPSAPNLVGLASVTHPAPSATAISSKASNLGEMNAEFEEADEEFVEQLTISQIEFCLLNETDEETRFWSSQPDGSDEELGGELGEMAGGLQNSRASPDGPCWACRGPHMKRLCPSRLKAVIAKSGGSSRSSQGGKGGRAFEEVRRGSSRRGRPPPRSRPAAVPSSRQVTDSRRGIFPVRDRRGVGELSGTTDVEGPAQPEGEELNGGEVGGLSI